MEIAEDRIVIERAEARLLRTEGLPSPPVPRVEWLRVLEFFQHVEREPRWERVARDEAAALPVEPRNEVGALARHKDRCAVFEGDARDTRVGAKAVLPGLGQSRREEVARAGRRARLGAFGGA